MLSFAIPPQSTYLLQLLDTLANSGELVKYVVKIERDVVCLYVGRDQNIVQRCTLAHLCTINGHDSFSRRTSTWKRPYMLNFIF